MALVSSTSSLGGFAGGNALARLLVVISGDTSQLESSLAKAAASSEGFGASMGSVGSALTRSVTLPVLAVAGAATFMAAQFQSGLARIAGLTPLLDQTGQSIGQVSDALLDLATEVPTSPNDLAESLYYAGSAGLFAAKGTIEATEAFQVVELSAKGAAIGMGEAGDITRVLIAALNNFRGDGLTAASAMDTLTAAIREGTAAPDELAISLGRLLPVAKQAGVSFEETAASVAALTNLGVPTRVATTSLRALFAELLAPTVAATTRLNELGISAEQLRSALSNLGPVGAFDLINKAVHGDEDALHDIIPQIRGFTAFVGLNNEGMKAYLTTLHNVEHAQGAFGRALAEIEQTPSFKFELALNKLRVAAIKTGAALFPIFEKLVSVIGDVADALISMSDPVRAVVIGVALLAASIGPLLKLLANLGVANGGLFSGFKSTAYGLVTMTIAAVAAINGFRSLADGSTNLFSILSAGVGTAVAVGFAIKALEKAAVAGALGAGALSEAFIGLGAFAPEIAVAAAAIAVSIGLIIGRAGQLNDDLNQMEDAFKTGVEAGDSLGQTLEGIKSEQLRQDLTEVAKQMHLINQPTGSALQDLIQFKGQELAGALADVRALSDVEGFAGISPEDLARFNKLSVIVGNAAANGKDMGAALKAAGSSSPEFSALLNDLAAGQDVTGDFAYQAEILAGEFGRLVDVNRDYHQTQLASIAGLTAEKGAVAGYAKELGVSTEFLEGQLNRFGQTALGLGEDGKAAFENLAFGVDENGDKISAKLVEMEAIAAEASAGIADSLRGAFAGFGVADTADNQIADLRKQLAAGEIKAKEFEEQFNELNVTVPEALKNITDNALGLVDTVGNLKTLADRGVKSDLLGFLADQDPATIQKFADASEGELKRLENMYSVYLAATDDAILQESEHQQKKGKDMVEGFVKSILTSSQLTGQGASAIVDLVAKGLGQGDFSQEGLRAGESFVRSLGSVKGLSQAQGDKVATAFLQGIQGKGDAKLEDAGHRLTISIAKGIARGSRLSIDEATRLVRAALSGADQVGKQEANPVGQVMANEYAHGITSRDEAVRGAGKGAGAAGKQGLSSAVAGVSAIGVQFVNAFIGPLGIGSFSAYAAAFAIGEAAKRGLDDGLHNSPEYFSFYAGQRLMDDLQRGIDSRPTPKITIPSLDKRGLEKALHLPTLKIDGRVGIQNNRFRVPDYPIGSPNRGRIEHRGRRHRRDIDLSVTVDRANVARETDWHERTRGRDG